MHFQSNIKLLWIILQQLKVIILQKLPTYICVYIYICVCVYIYVCIYIYIYISLGTLVPTNRDRHKKGSQIFALQNTP